MPLQQIAPLLQNEIVARAIEQLSNINKVLTDGLTHLKDVSLVGSFLVRTTLIACFSPLQQVFATTHVASEQAHDLTSKLADQLHTLQVRSLDCPYFSVQLTKTPVPGSRKRAPTHHPRRKSRSRRYGDARSDISFCIVQSMSTAYTDVRQIMSDQEKSTQQKATDIAHYVQVSRLEKRRTT